MKHGGYMSQRYDKTEEWERKKETKKPARSFQELEVWQRAHQFVLAIYHLSMVFPAEERYGLTSQFRRAAISIAANIAEGFGKYSAAEKARLLNIAQGSLEECRYYCILAQDLGYGDTQELQAMLDGIAFPLSSYIRLLRQTR